MLDFKPITAGDRELLEAYTYSVGERGCDYTFANLFAWGHHEYAIADGMLFIRYLSGEPCYLFPIGQGDALSALRMIKEDAEERKVPLLIKGATATEAPLLKEVFGEDAEVGFCRDCSDYVYSVHELATLKGKKYHGKRGHLGKFVKEFPAFRVQSITQNSIPALEDFLDTWYASRSANEGSFELERCAVMRLLTHKDELSAEALMLTDGERILAFTVGSRCRHDTFDVHFEKASPDAPTAYTAMNVEFARYVSANFPEVQYLNREDDMGIEGLRSAKESWYPCRMLEKYTAKEKKEL